MNKLQQAAKEKALKDQITDILTHNLKHVPQLEGIVSFGAIQQLYNLVEAAEEAAEGAFAEWANEQLYVWWNGLWERDGEKYTTSELYQLWQQSLI